MENPQNQVHQHPTPSNQPATQLTIDPNELRQLGWDLFPGSILVTGRDGRILFVNEFTRNQFGIDVGSNIVDFIVETGENNKNIRRIAEDGRLDNFEIQSQNSNGDTVWVLVSSRLVKLNEHEVFLTSLIDITERKLAEKALLESEEHYRTLVANLPIPIFTKDRNGRYISSNAENQKYWATNIVGKTDAELLSPEEASALRDADISVMKSGNKLTVEEFFKKTHIGVRHMLSRKVPLLDSTGNIIGILGASIDITEQRQAEARLARHTERLSILNLMEQAITSSLELDILLDMLTNKVVELLHVDACTVLLLDEQTNRLKIVAKQGFKTKALDFTNLEIGTGFAGQAALEHKIVYTPRIAEVNNNPILQKSIQEEDIVSYIGVPLIAKEQLLGVLEIFNRSEMSPEPDWLEFLDTLASQVAISIDNSRLFELTQQSLKEANALYQINKDLIATIDHELLMANIVNLLQQNFGYYYVQIFVADPKTGNFVMRAGSGEIGEKLKAQEYYLSAGEGIVGFTAETGKPFVTNDVDQLISSVRMPYLENSKSELAVPIKAKEQILGLLDIHQIPPARLTNRDVQLVSAVADQLAVALQKASLYADLQEALRQEKTTRSQLIQFEKLSLSGRLLASVSHELNNPIQAIQNALFLLKNDQGITEQGKQDLNIILSETERMANLLDRLRSTYQPASNEEFQPVQINELIKDTRALVAAHLRHSQISFEFKSDPELPIIHGLSSQLRQVILNLVMNAAEAMKTGGRMIVETSFIQEHREILITVKDTGVGINPGIMPNIFDAFVTNKKQGTGLGLAISYEIILKHRGRIHAENNQDGGAKFSVWLPINVEGDE